MCSQPKKQLPTLVPVDQNKLELNGYLLASFQQRPLLYNVRNLSQAI